MKTNNVIRQLVLAVATVLFVAAVIEGAWLTTTAMGFLVFGMISSLWSTRDQPPQ